MPHLPHMSDPKSRKRSTYYIISYIIHACISPNNSRSAVKKPRRLSPYPLYDCTPHVPEVGFPPPIASILINQHQYITHTSSIPFLHPSDARLTLLHHRSFLTPNPHFDPTDTPSITSSSQKPQRTHTVRSIVNIIHHSQTLPISFRWEADPPNPPSIGPFSPKINHLHPSTHAPASTIPKAATDHVSPSYHPSTVPISRPQTHVQM